MISTRFAFVLLFVLASMESRFAGAVVPAHPITDKPWLRLDDAARNLKVDESGRFAAFFLGNSGLHVLDLTSKEIYLVSPGSAADQAFFWAPHGSRLFFRARTEMPDKRIKVAINAYDTYLKKTIVVDEIKDSTGFLSFDPLHQRINYLNRLGHIAGKGLLFPDNRLAEWQKVLRARDGFWVATHSGILWISELGKRMTKMVDDGAATEDFDISPDGRAIAWSTRNDNLYVSRAGAAPVSIGKGHDPSWHSDKAILVFAGARMIGNVVAGYDLRMTDDRGQGKWLTESPHSDERYPRWYPHSNKIIYTKERTTDLYIVDGVR